MNKIIQDVDTSYFRTRAMAVVTSIYIYIYIRTNLDDVVSFELRSSSKMFHVAQCLYIDIVRVARVFSVGY